MTRAEGEKETYSVEVVGSFFDKSAGTTITRKGTGVTPKCNYETGYRTFGFTCPALAGVTNLTEKEVTLGEENGKLAIKVKDLNKEGGADEIYMVDGGTVYDKSDVNSRSQIATTTLSYNSAHSAHSWTVMEWNGVKTFTSSKAAAASSTGVHMLECACGVQYLKEDCSSNKDSTAAPTASTSCWRCGYTLKTDAYKNVHITDDSSVNLYLLVAAGTKLDLSGSKIALFNMAEVNVKGWSLVNALWTSDGVELTADQAVLTFTENK